MARTGVDVARLRLLSGPFGPSMVDLAAPPDGLVVADIPAVAGGLFGAELRELGDLDGDGAPDLAVIESWWQRDGTNAGAIHLFSGGRLPGASSLEGVSRVEGPAGINPTFGFGVATADLDGDGRLDLAASAPFVDPVEGFGPRGAVYVLLGPWAP